MQPLHGGKQLDHLRPFCKNLKNFLHLPCRHERSWNWCLKKFFVHLLRQKQSFLIVRMRIYLRHHAGLRVTGVALNRLDVAAADLELDRGAAVPQTVKHSAPQFVFLNEHVQHSVDLTPLIRAATPDCARTKLKSL